MRRKLLFILLTTSLLCAEQESSNFFDRNYEDCSIDPVVTRVELKHRENKGVGYDDGYTTLSTFIAPNVSDRVMCFFDGRGHVLNDGKLASNLGVGLRVAALEKFAIGLNSYWDFRQVKHLPSHQVGAGLELLSPYADFRLNGYLPFGDKTYTKKAKFDRFSGNDIIFKQKTKAELTTIYGEVGAPIPGIFRAVDLYLATGPYYIFTRTVGLHRGKQDKTPAAWGGKFRASARVYDGLELGMNVTYDHIFKWNVQGVVSFSFPFGPGNMRTQGKRWKEKFKGRCKDFGQFKSLMNQPVERNEIIPVLEKTFRKNLGVNCVFVDNSNPLPGNGTFENPFQNLQLTQNGSNPYDCIYLFQGNRTYSTDFGGLAGFSFQLGQTMTGSATPFQIDGIIVPPQSAGNPVMTNPLGNALTLAEHVTVQGVTVTGSAGLGINASTVGNFTIQNNVITENASGQIGGGFVAPMNPGTKVIRNNTTQDSSGERLIYLTRVQDGELLIVNNSLESSSLPDAIVDIDVQVTDEINIIFSHNTVIGEAIDGVLFSSLGATNPNSVAYLTCQNNTITTNTSSALEINSLADLTHATVIDNTLSGSLDVDIRISRPFTGIIKNNALLAGGVICALFNPGEFCLDISGNTTPATYNLQNFGGVSDYRIKSTDGTLSGVTDRNAPGSVFNVPINPITFIPVDASCPP